MHGSEGGRATPRPRHDVQALSELRGLQASALVTISKLAARFQARAALARTCPRRRASAPSTPSSTKFSSHSVTATHGLEFETAAAQSSSIMREYVTVLGTLSSTVKAEGARERETGPCTDSFTVHMIRLLNFGLQ